MGNRDLRPFCNCKVSNFNLLRADVYKLFLAFGAALDPRQKRAHSPGFSPWLVGLSVGASITATGNIRQGFPGAGMETCT